MTKRTTGDDASSGLAVPAGSDPAAMKDWAEGWSRGPGRGGGIDG